MDPVVIVARLLLIVGCSGVALVPAELGLSDTLMDVRVEPRPVVARVPTAASDPTVPGTYTAFVASPQLKLEQGLSFVPVIEPQPTPVDLRLEPAQPVPQSPVWVRIPAQGIDARVVPVGLTASGEMETPAAYDQVGWYRHGARPGESGRAVLAGHLDSRDGPAVFFQLGSLQPGNTIEVQFDDDSDILVFTVRELARFPVDGAPLGDIFGPVDRPELVLITCAGVFEGPESGYSERVIVYADLASGT